MVQEIITILLSGETIIALLVGVVGGMVIGALPGLSATMGVALLIPITYSMSPSAALIMLSAVYTSAVYGGSISAILIHTPGTPASAATALDGYALTQNGQGLKAIGVSTISSVIGGTLSAIALLVIAPPLAKFSLSFSAAEYFLIGVFGLTIIGSLSSGSMLKGFIAGVLGLMFCMIGPSYNGFLRFTFGNMNLYGGIALVPALVGLFSMPQVMVQSEKCTGRQLSNVNEEIGEIKGAFFPTSKEMAGLVPTIVRSSVLGIFIGILPGAGGDIASWVAYNEAKRVSKNRDKFGKGALEGVCASETANNAVTGGALIPLLTLGIPGSATAAVLMGGLTIHGLQPGWQLFDKYATITYSIISGFLIANILMGVVGGLIARYVVRVSSIPLPILLPIIVVLSVLGSYSMNNNMFDVYIMLGFGVLGFFMRKLGFMPAPTVLALILGSMLENNLSQAVMMSRGDPWGYFFSRPLCLVIMALIFLAVFAPKIVEMVNKKINPHYNPSAEAEED